MSTFTHSYSKFFSLSLRTLAGVSAMALGLGCGKGDSPTYSNAVVKATATLQMTLPNEHQDQLNPPQTQTRSQNYLSSQTPISVINTPFTTMSVDTSQFIIPKIVPSILDFGQIAIVSLTDNNLKVCGSDGKTRCNQALIRMYTIGEDGPGLYNRQDGYGMPLFSSLANGTQEVLPLGPTEVAVLQSFPIPTHKNVLRLSDFPASPLFQLKSDFSNAGVGTYNTTLVLEYALAL